MSNFLDIQVKSWENEDIEKGVFIALANKRWFKDRVGDVTTDTAFSKSIKRHKENGTMPKLLLQHKPDQVIGVFLDMWEDEQGLWVKGQLCLETELGRETHALMKQGALDAMSIGYITVEEKYDPSTKSNFLIEVDVLEVSVVTFPCNVESKIASVKSDEAEEIASPETGINTLVNEHEAIEPEQNNDDSEKELVALNEKLDAFILNSKISAFLNR